MQILILNWRDIKNPSSGGAEILTQEIAKRWVKWGHQVILFTSSFKGCLKEETIDGVKIIRDGHPDARHLFSSVHFLAFLYYQRKMRNKVDIVIDEIHGLPFFIPWYVREKKIALICEVAGELWKRVFGFIFGTIGRAVEKFYLRTIYRNTEFLTISPSTKEDLISNGVRKEQIKILPMGVTLPRGIKTAKKEKNLTLIFVGRLSKAKGIEDAILAAGHISKKNSKVKLWVVGRGDRQYLSYLKKLSKKLKIDDRVIFFGFVKEKKKFELMGRAHLLIHSSLREGFGLTIPEAGIVGTPVITYNSPGLRDVVRNNKNGILISQNSPEYIAKVVEEILNNKDRYKRLCRNAQLAAKQYNWDNTAKTALLCLERL